MKNHYLYICSSGLVGLRMNGAALEQTGRFDSPAQSNAGAAQMVADQFSAWLAQHRTDRFRILVDSSEEEIVLEELPPLSRRDRTALIEKRLGLRYRDLRFKTWMPFALLGPKPSGFSALTGRQASASVVALIRGEAVLSPWIGLIESAQVCLESVHSTALLAAPLVRRLQRSGNGLLLSMQPGGLRQSLILNGALRFSRLAPVLRVADYNTLAVEIENTIQYLLMSQIVQRDQLDADFFIWALPAGLPDLSQQQVQLVESGNNQAITVVEDNSRRLMAPEQAIDLASLPSWIALLDRSKYGSGYATRAQKIYLQAMQARRWLRVGAIGVSSACLLATVGLETYRYFRFDPTSLLKRYQYQIIEKQEVLNSAHSEFGVTGAELSLIAQAAAALRKRQAPADSIASMISSAIDSETDLRIERFAWQRPAFDTAGAMVQGASPGSGSTSAPAARLAAAASPALLAGATRGGQSNAVDYTGIDKAAVKDQLTSDLIIELQGIVPVRIGKSESNQRVEGLRNRLKRLCQCEVDILKWPFDNSPAATLKGDFAGKHSRQSVPFEIRATIAARTDSP